MTSPISLLAPLAGSDPVPAIHPSAEDPAVFAAALIAAIQLLQAPPLPAPVAEAPIVVEGEENGDELVAGEEEVSAERAEGAGAAEGGACTRPAVEEPSLAAPPVSSVQLEQADTLRSNGPATPSAPDGAGRAVADACRPKPTAVSTRLDVISDEPALPVAIDPAQKSAPSLPTHLRPVAIAPDQAREAPRLKGPGPAPMPSKPETSRPEHPVSVKPSGEVLSAGRNQRKATPDAVEKTGRQQERERQVAATPSTGPGQGFVDPVLMPMPAALLPEPVRVALPDNRAPASPSGAEHESPIASQQAGPTESVVMDTAGAQIQNGRLAAQLAELVGDLNVTEFRVDLARRRVAPAESGGKAKVGSPAQPVVKMDSGVSGQRAIEIDIDPTALSPERSTVPGRRDGDRAAVGAPVLTRLPGPGVGLAEDAGPAPSDAPHPAQGLPAEKAPVRQEAAPGRVVMPSGPTADAIELLEPRAPAMPRPRIESAVPTLPPVRQELPAAEKPAADYRPDRSVAGRTDREDPSEAAAPGSLAAPNFVERVTDRNEGGAARGTREARNLPQDPTGNERPAGLADRVTVEVSDAEGRQTRIRVSVVGDQVRAVIVPPDAETARQLERRMDDLQTALARQGFAGSKVLVQQAGEGVLERGGAAFAGLTGGNESRAATSPGRDQPAGDQRQGRNQREQHPGDGQRHPNGRSRDQGAEHRRR